MSNEGAASRPGGLTAVCIIAIVLGTLGVCCGLVNGAGLATQDRVEGVNRNLVERTQRDPGLREGQLHMQDEIKAYSRRWMPVIATLTFAGILLAVLLIVGGALAINMKSGGRVLLFAVCLGAPLFELVRTTVEGFYSWELNQILQRSLAHQLASTAVAHGQAGGGVLGGMSVGLAFGGMIGVALTVALALAKIVYYLVTAFYLRKPEIRSLYG